jgi:hypothetical protein
MTNWVQEKAYAEASIWHDPCELWSALITRIQEAVATWTAIYSQPGTQEIVVSSPADSVHSSFTVTVTPVGAAREDGLEVAFDPSRNLIQVTPQPYKKTFHVYVDQAQNRVGLKQQDVPSSKDLSIEDACRLILEPLIEGLGHRRRVGIVDP